MKQFTLHEGGTMPALGFGTWQLTGNECSEATQIALETGYRHIDTAIAYGNHKEIAKAIKEHGLPREELFITSKIPPSSFHETEVLEAGDRILKELETDYLDLLLMHWPNRDVPLEETLGAFQELKNDGKVRNIGVSNFTIRHLQEAINTGIEFSVNQVELHPSLQQKELQQFCLENNIIITAYSPIAQGDDLDLPVITELAKKYDRTPSQVILNWIMDKGMSAIPRSSKKEHIEDNFAATEWELEPDDIARIDIETDTGNRLIAPAWSEFED